MTAALLTTANLTKRFGGIVATDDVSLEVRRHEVHALIGPNGAGKTTLIAQLAGLLASDSGSITFDGKDIANKYARLTEKRIIVSLRRGWIRISSHLYNNKEDIDRLLEEL